MKHCPGEHRAGVFALAAILLGLLAGCGSPSVISSPPPPTPTSAVSTSPPVPTTVTPSPTPDATAGWVNYQSPANHLTFRHPANMKPLECGWVFIDPTNPASCPQGDGFCCVFLRSSDNGQTGNFSLISTNPSLYPGGIQRSTVIVDGVTGTRLSGTQTVGQGGGPQVEYDFKTQGRTYNFFAYVGGSPSYLEATAPTASLFDQIVQTIIFTS